MEAYIGMKNLLIDQRIELVKCQLQEDELINTERENNKISHPVDEGGGHGDLADAVTGSSYTLITEQVTARPPSRNLANIAAAVNSGRSRTPMLSSKSSSTFAKPSTMTPSLFGSNTTRKF